MASRVSRENLWFVLNLRHVSPKDFLLYVRYTHTLCLFLYENNFLHTQKLQYKDMGDIHKKSLVL